MMSDRSHDNYYVTRKDKLIRQLDKAVSRLHQEMAASYGEPEAETIHQEILVEFERLLPEIPYIGGRKNSLTMFLIQSAWALAFYRVLQRRGGSVEDAGALLQQAAEAMFTATPRFLRRLYGRIRSSKLRSPLIEAAAHKTQQRVYPGNWVQEIVPADGETFDLGFDYTECGIVKFMAAQGAPELTPYLCQTDFAVVEAIGLRLERTETIADGFRRCDFRISRS